MPRPIRIGVDFGTDALILAFEDPERVGDPDRIPGLKGTGTWCAGGAYEIPSLIHYHDNGTMRLGCEIPEEERDAEGTARNLRHYLFDNSPVRLRTGDGSMVQYRDAARDFLQRVLSRAVGGFPGGADLVFALPGGSPADLPQWLDSVGRAAGARSSSWVSECTAAASVYDLLPASGEAFFVLSCTGTEMAVTLGIVGENGIQAAGQVSSQTGHLSAESWIVQDLLNRFRLIAAEPRAERIRSGLFREAARARELIPREGTCGIVVTDPEQGRTYTARYDMGDLLRVLEEHGFGATVRDLLDRALLLLRAKGLDKGSIAAILMTGRGCTLPGVTGCIGDRFPGVPIRDDHLPYAIARGALRCPQSVQAPDRIRNTYALRYWDPQALEHHYRFLVHAGTRFPSRGQVARITISAAYDGQTHLGIPLWEMRESRNGDGGIELVSDRSGGVHIAGPTQDAALGAPLEPLNEPAPTLLVADPPAQKGQPRFECTFSIDRERNLCLSARDLITGALVKLNAPVCQLK